jgi:hypothetical protein
VRSYLKNKVKKAGGVGSSDRALNSKSQYQSVILTTLDAEIRRIKVHGQPKQYKACFASTSPIKKKKKRYLVPNKKN